MLTGTLESVTTAETWTDTLEFFDDETGEPWFTEADTDSHPDEVTLKLRNPANGQIVLSGALSSGELVIVADGIIEFTFAASSMAGLNPKTYEAGILYEAEDITKQLFLGNLPVLKGL